MTSSDFEAACRELVARSFSADGSVAEIAALARRVTATQRWAGPVVIERQADALLRVVRDAPTRHAANVALTIGALVEHGLSPQRVAHVILERCRTALELALPAYERLGTVVDRLAQEPYEDLASIGGFDIPPAELGRIEAESPESVEAYRYVDLLCLPSIACLTRDADLRREARSDARLGQAAAVVARPADSLRVARPPPGLTSISADSNRPAADQNCVEAMPEASEPGPSIRL